MNTHWHHIEPLTQERMFLSDLPVVSVESIPVYNDARGTLYELFRSDDMPAGFRPVMACSSWSLPGVTRGPHEHREQDDYFTFAGPSEFLVVLWDGRHDRPHYHGWLLRAGESHPTRLFVPRGVVHAYRNVGSVPGLVVTVTNLLYHGECRKLPVDEIRHECDPHSPYHFPETEFA